MFAGTLMLIISFKVKTQNAPAQMRVLTMASLPVSVPTEKEHWFAILINYKM
jgi:hypothetical protein